MCSGQVCKSFGDIHEKFTVLAEQNAACPFIYARRATKVEGNKCRTKAKELLRAYSLNIYTVNKGMHPTKMLGHMFGKKSL